MNADQRPCDWCDRPAVDSVRRWGGTGIHARFKAEIRIYACERHRSQLAASVERSPKAPPLSLRLPLTVSST